MSDKDQVSDENIDEQIRQTMSEAEAAVEELQSGTKPSESAVEAEVIELEAEVEEEGPNLTQQLETKVKEVADTRDKWLRAVADLENYKKRSKRELDDAVLRGSQDLLKAFLPVADNLERALEAAGDRDDDLVKGVRMVAGEFNTALGKQGISAVESVGLPFDPSLHEALQMVDSPEHEPGTVIREFERGYTQKGRLLRPARVIIASSTSGSSGGAES